MNNWKNFVVLIVEDSVVQRAHLVELVKSLNFGLILEACDGVDALRVLEAHGTNAIDLVLTDLDMPAMDGIELIRHLSERQLTKHLIVVSARDPRMLEVVEAMGTEDAGLHLLGTVVKPVKLDDLKAILQRIEKNTRARVGLPERARFTLEELEVALTAGQFLPFFQPMISLTSGVVKGVEALARWQHPEYGLLAPIHFIPRIEGSPLMLPFTLSMVGQIMRQLVAWRKEGMPVLTVSINLSAENLSDPDFIEQLVNLSIAHGIAPESLIWEVTETVVMSNLSQCLANLVRLRLKGFGLAMDDYGIGYSSMQQLSRCPFTELKIDRTFVDGAAGRPNRRAVLDSSIDMGHRLGAFTVAEGVETMADWELLQELGCDIAQGYLIAKPMAAGELKEWIEVNQGRLQSLAEKIS
jgi:EAL domain-containing protein (putative c-di-GMP-specific phosphodiesterase class I)/DNA-binding NarL/FixJ family response regulator